MGIILPNTDSDGAAIVAQLIQDRLEQQNIPHQTSSLDCVSVSIGIASAAGSDLDQWQGLIEAADQALYSGKTAGRSRVVKHSVTQCPGNSNQVSTADQRRAE